MENISEIWELEEERIKSNVDKISYESILQKVESIENQLFEDGREDLFIQARNGHPNLGQSVLLLEEHELKSKILNKLLVNVDKKDLLKKSEYLIHLLAHLDLIIPKRNVIIKGNKSFENRSFIVPLLFPLSKPRSLFLKNGESLDTKRFKQSLKAIYYLPFKPNSIWKMVNNINYFSNF